MYIYMKFTIKWTCLRKNSYQKLSNSYCLWLYRPNAVYATRKGRPISNFDGIWVNGYLFFLSFHISIHLYPLFVYKWPIDRFILPIDQTKSVFFHLKVIIKSKKGPPCIFWPAHRSYIYAQRLLNQIFISEYRGHTGYILFGGEMQMKDICKCIGVCYNSILFIEGPMQSFQHMSSSQSSFNANAMRK